MTLKEIEKQATKKLVYDKYTQKEVDELILKTINKCIDNNIKFNINEIDLLRIINIYYRIYNKYDFEYFKKIINNSNSKIDYYKIFQNLNK